ncbi:unnamed protein product [Bursaphelenchus xylophilus]|nr:unnamed protein product [Bursaphelenchus xylophilus]CAG9131469.1 unnamed protein product [Bursaphelenchus xylophilus]
MSLNKKMAGVKLSGDSRKTVPGKSTIFEMTVEPGRKVYRFDVEITLIKPKTEKVLTKQVDPGLRILQRTACVDCIEHLHRQNKIPKYAYDGKRTLFTLSDMKQFTIDIDSKQLPAGTKDYARGNVLRVDVTSNAKVPVFDFTNLETALVDNIREQADHSPRQFLEILTSQYLVNTGDYQIIASGTLFNKQCLPMVPGMEIRVGLSKGIRVSEYNGKIRPLLVADMRRTAFYTSTKPLSVIFQEFGQVRVAFERHFRGVRCYGTHRKGFTFAVRGLTKDPVGHPSCNAADKTLAKYYKDTYNVVIDTRLPGVVADIPGKTCIIPLEVAKPLEGQLVPAEKINEQAVRKLVMENSIQPQDRYNFVTRKIGEICDGKGAQFLKEFGVTVSANSNDVAILQSKVCDVEAAGKKIIRPMPNGAFMKEAVDMRFFNPANLLKKWWVVVDQRTVDQRQVQQYIPKLLGYANKAGLALPPPLQTLAINLDDLQRVFQKARDDKIQYIFYIDDGRARSHHALKLFEAYYKVLTQQVITKNLADKPQTLKNVVMKINAKAFGINYMPVFPKSLEEFDIRNKNDLLIIGYDVAHPPPAQPADKRKMQDKEGDPFAANEARGRLRSLQPSVVGICANMSKNPMIFGGDFFYQESRRENVEPEKLRKAVKQLCERAKAAGRPIKRVLVIRDGISEGQFQYAVSQELPAIKSGFKDVFVGPEASAKFSFVVATKQHNKRFYEVVAGKIENTRPGDVVDRKVTRSDITEFYLQSHNPLKGVPKMTQYSEIANELNIEPEKLQALMQVLSTMHQVCACPTSLPLPVYMADELAKRGSDIFKAFINLPPNNEVRKNVRSNNGLEDFNELTDVVSYSKHPLGGTRFNA